MSADWTAGYVTDVDYTAGYYPELNPVRSRLPLLAAGFEPPHIAAACELGFGKGLSLALHAAAQPAVEWWGTDFNPDHAAYARSLLAGTRAEERVSDQGFEAFCVRDDLPQFDFIALHGTWSWVSDENRGVLTDFIRRKLRLGGLLFISYNCQPAWAPSMPLRHLMKLHSDVMGAPGQGTVARIDAAIGFIERLFATGPNALLLNPGLADRLTSIKSQNRAYVAHEYMNRDWAPMAFSDVHAQLDQAKVGFACSAEALDQVELLQLKPEQSALLAEIADPALRETARDFCVNRQFRRDYWMRGLNPLSPGERQDLKRSERVVLTTPRANVAKTVMGNLAQMVLPSEVYDPILDLLADHKPRSLAEIETALGGRLPAEELATAVLVLAGQGGVSSAQPPEEAADAAAACRALNRKALERARWSDDLGYLACPATGGALPAPRFQRLFALAAEQSEHPADWAASSWQILKSQGQTLAREGTALVTDQDNLAALTEQAEGFGAAVLPMWRALGAL
jgi:hypothetical protein